MASRTSRIVRPSTAMRDPGHGEVNKWLYRHRRAILNIIKKDGRVRNWTHFMGKMAEDGVTRPSGKPLTARAVSDAWGEVAAALERERKAQPLDLSKTPPRSYRPNAEPPSRPPPAYDAIRYPSPLTAEPPGWRERNVLPRGASTQPSAEQAVTHRPPASGPAGANEPVSAGTLPAGNQPRGRRSAAEKLAEVDRQLRAADGFQLTPRNRGRII